MSKLVLEGKPNVRLFHISDVLTVTTGRLVSNRHIDGFYDILNFLTGDSLFTHQLPRAMDESKPWLRSMFPDLMEDSEGMPERLADLDRRLQNEHGDSDQLATAIAGWVEDIRAAKALPLMIPVYELGADMHTRIDPLEELSAMVGNDRVIVVDAGSQNVDE